MRSGAFVLLVVPLLALGVGSAAILPPPVPEALVEGHTVFAVLEQVNGPTGETNATEFAAAVAVLVREVTSTETTFFSRFPGVLWFNDQYLVDPQFTEEHRDASYRHPCSGAVLAVNQGDAVPFRGSIPSNDGATYLESYHVVDPNDHTWRVDRWWVLAGSQNVSLWTVAILGNDLLANESDDGSCEGTAFEDGCAVPAGPLGCADGGDLEMIHVGGAPTTTARDPGAHGRGYPCGGEDATCNALSYNAVLYFLLADLTIDAGVKDHREAPGSDREADVSGCQASTVDWPCPDGDDDREGNSHPYNPESLLWPGAGLGNHGGSDAAETMDVHAARSVDLYYGVATTPLTRIWRVFDVSGSNAPYHCHEGAPCALVAGSAP